MAIPKIFIHEGVQATKAAKEAIASIKRLTKTEVFNPVKNPASELFEKAGVMKSKAFWQDPQNFANYARGQYLTEGGASFQQAREIGDIVLSKSKKLERGFSIYPGQNPHCITYYERNLLTGEKQTIELLNGKPYYTDIDAGRVKIYYNPKTGAPLSKKEIMRTTDGRYWGERLTRFADDGKTVLKTDTRYAESFIGSPYSRDIVEFAPDGSYTVKSFAKKNEGTLASLEKYSAKDLPKRKIEFQEGTRKPASIYDYNELGQPGKIHLFDLDGNLLKS